MLKSLIKKLEFPHHGKMVIFKGRDREDPSIHIFGIGKVNHNRIVVDNYTHAEPDEDWANKINEAAIALRVPPSIIEQRLEKGEQVMYRPRKERE